MEEIWKDAVGYEGRYQVSNLGRIRSVERNVVTKRGSHVKIERIVMKQHEDKDGYLRVALRGEKGRRMIFVHRAVALAFVPNPQNLPMINHKDENKQNNISSNLEWCDARYNNTYGHRLNIVSKILTCRSDLSKPVLQYDKEGNVVAEYGSIREAARRVGGNQSYIGKVCKGIHKSAYGFVWKYKE